MKRNLFAQRLKSRRKEKGYTQEFLGEMLGYNKSAICDWETRDKEPRYDILISLSQILDCTTDYLLGVVDTNDKDF